MYIYTLAKTSITELLYACSRLIDWKVFYAVSVIFQPYNGGHAQEDLGMLLVMVDNFPIDLLSLICYHAPSDNNVDFLKFLKDAKDIFFNPKNYKTYDLIPISYNSKLKKTIIYFLAFCFVH